MSSSVNGWPVLSPGSPKLHRWVLPGTQRAFTLRNGSVGFLLMHNALFIHEKVERLDLGTWDEWGHNVRPISGTSVYSNHSSGSATDLNSSRHPYKVAIEKTFTKKQISAIRNRLRLYRGVLTWGGNWSPKWVDGMHWEISDGKTMRDAERMAKLLMYTPRGRRILKANPGQKEVIIS
jgi:hypothetical protein